MGKSLLGFGSSEITLGTNQKGKSGDGIRQVFQSFANGKGSIYRLTWGL